MLALPKPPSHNRGGPTSKGREGKEREEGAERRGGEEKERKGKNKRERREGMCPLTLSPGYASVRGKLKAFSCGRFLGVGGPNVTKLGDDICSLCVFQSLGILLTFQTRFAQN